MLCHFDFRWVQNWTNHIPCNLQWCQQYSPFSMLRSISFANSDVECSNLHQLTFVFGWLNFNYVSRERMRTICSKFVESQMACYRVDETFGFRTGNHVLRTCQLQFAVTQRCWGYRQPLSKWRSRVGTRRRQSWLARSCRSAGRATPCRSWNCSRCLRNASKCQTAHAQGLAGWENSSK